jgi:hypothetical protein
MWDDETHMGDPHKNTRGPNEKKLHPLVHALDYGGHHNREKSRARRKAHQGGAVHGFAKSFR